ncbi:hypothetical protein [Scleromatobacter humisilvae]|uniref:Uncharacterized protein n=1 Tax=Scleromatobacter humisilvae TaxID=2897159 RepID=A0A9X2C1T3_9BURK|nr:hypothetical protein [Scleromatobacter humisilvae]MCK9689178.1 hypothetical protein [Scleromatobacter humisilvae]
MAKPPRHEPTRDRWGPAVGFLAIAFALVAGALAGGWSSLVSATTEGDAASAPAASASAPLLQVAAAGVPAPARVTPASAPASSAAATSPQIPRHRDPDGDQTPDIADYINAGEKPTMNEVIERLHQAGVHTGLGAFNPPGTKPPLIGLAVPEDFPLPPGYVRHYQATDDGQRIEPILMFAPDYQATTPDGQPVAMPRDRVVPPELAPPGLPIRRIVVPPPNGAL